MLAMKPGERPTNFERRRDLWLIPHSQKILTRMVNVEYDRAARRCVLSSQAGFTPGRNAGEHALAMRLAAEQAMVERKPLYRGFVDFGVFFMSICHTVSHAVEKRSGVAPAAIDVIRALRVGVEETCVPGLKGRYETAYGLTDPVDILKGLCQGDLSSPRRASLVMNIPFTCYPLNPGGRYVHPR